MAMVSGLSGGNIRDILLGALTPGPGPRVDAAGARPARRGGSRGGGRPRGGHHGSTVARTATVRAIVAPAPAAGGQPGSGVPAGSALC
jgi:hypothetical protein